MNSPKNPNGKKDDPYTINATVKSQWNSPAIIISMVLLAVSFGLAIVNYITYRRISNFNVQTIDNYKIRNRPFVKLTPLIVYIKEQSEEKTKFQLDLKVENFGHIPAFVEATDIWIVNISDNSENIIIWDSKKPYAIKRFALFRNKEESFGREFTLAKADIVRIKEAETVYVAFSIKYNVFSIKEHLHEGPFYYWAIYRCEKFLPDKGEPNKSFLIEECGDTELNPTSDNNEFKKRQFPKSTQTTTTSIISPAWPISP